MHRLRALLMKDLTLFLRGAGLVALLLPFLLLLFFVKEKESLLSDVTLKPFPIAIRDEDETYMSRTLIHMVGEVELFSKVDVVKEESDAELFAKGYAAVTTIPKDFFYEMYVSDKRPALLSLNEGMPLQATLYRAVFTSVMDVIRMEEAAHYGMYFFVYGKLSRQQKIDAYNETSENLFLDILGRQQVFDSDLLHSDAPSSDLRRLVSILLSVVTVLFLTGFLSSVPEERKKRILPRFVALGGNPFYFALSRYLLFLLFLTPILIAVCLLDVQVGRLFLFLCLLVPVSAVFLAVSALGLYVSGARMMRRVGSVYLLFSLILSGTIWPLRGLPVWMSYLQRLTLPDQFRMILEMPTLTESGREMIPFLLVHLCLFLFGWMLPRFYRPKREEEQRKKGRSTFQNPAEVVENLQKERGMTCAEVAENAQTVAEEDRPKGRTKALFRGCLLTLSKLRLIAGRRREAGGMILVLLLCGALTAFLQKGEGREIHLLIWDEDQTQRSAELVERMTKVDGLRVSLKDRKEAEGERKRDLITGDAEGMLVIPSGYGRAIVTGKDARLHFESKASSFSNQGLREIIAGQNNILKAEARARLEAQKRLSHPLSEQENHDLSQWMKREESTFPPLYKIETEKETEPEGSLKDPFAPDSFHFAIFGVMILLFAEAEVFASVDHRRVERRMRTCPQGVFVMRFSDLAALVLTGGVVLLCFLLPGQAVFQRFVPVLLFLIILASLALLLAYRSKNAGRSGAIAPYLALLLGLGGGCFTDVSAFSGLLGKVYPFLPSGALFGAASGQQAGGETALLVLVMQSMFFIGILGVSCFRSQR
ncbi:MAG: ABC transporter permease [Lachnospiraceae bacterium]|nr:ABC transporter permease [Lachnospiraceae bacterium]